MILTDSRTASTWTATLEPDTLSAPKGPLSVRGFRENTQLYPDERGKEQAMGDIV